MGKQQPVVFFFSLQASTLSFIACRIFRQDISFQDDRTYPGSKVLSQSSSNNSSVVASIGKDPMASSSGISASVQRQVRRTHAGDEQQRQPLFRHLHSPESNETISPGLYAVAQDHDQSPMAEFDEAVVQEQGADDKSTARVTTYMSSAHPDPDGGRIFSFKRGGLARIHHLFVNSWMFEAISIMLAVGLMVAITTVLARFNGQVVPDWPLSISLNTLVALLSTIARALVLVTVAAVIGQDRWAWFSSRARAMNHFQRFDDASRGLLGSLCLLFVAPGSPVAVFGSVVVILSLAMGPFAQQAIKSVECSRYVPGVNASVPVAHSADLMSLRLGAGLYTIDYVMRGVMINGLLNPTGNDSAVPVTCPTGNCTFAVDSENVAYSSIGLCSSCLDVASFVDISNVTQDSEPDSNITWYNINYTLPNGGLVQELRPNFAGEYQFNVLDVRADADLSWASSAFTDDFMTAASSSIINVTILLTNIPADEETSAVPLTPAVYVAAACAFNPCLKNYYGNVTMGDFTEEVISAVPALHAYSIHPSINNYTALKTPCVIDGVEYSSSNNFSGVPANHTITTVTATMDYNYTAPDECLYNLPVRYASGMSDFMGSTIMNGTCGWEDLGPNGIALCPETFWLASLYSAKNATFDTVSTAMEQFATTVTNKFRTSGTSNEDSSRREAALGVVSQTTVCIAFQWQWLLLPICVVATAAALLVCMMVRSGRNPSQPVWKSSLLPFLFYRHEDTSTGLTAPGRPAVGLGELNAQAAKTVVRWRPGVDAGFAVDRTSNGGFPRRGADEQDINMDSLLGDES